MRKLFFTYLLMLLCSISIAQPAPNFNCNDCSGVSHDFYTELNAGKVIVLCWVMPCAVCVGPSLTTYNVVQSYQSTQPGKVKFYLVDDYGDTPCLSLQSWANTNHLNTATVFSDASISMSAFGVTGMPVIAVVGGVSHKIFYVGKNTVDVAALQSAIDSAILTTAIYEIADRIPVLGLQQNPSHGLSVLNCTLSSAAVARIDLYSLEGKRMETIYSGNLAAGRNRIPVDLSGYRSGLYFINYSEGAVHKSIKILITH
ncbi:MAG TPA: hypothetical protein PLU53_15315 [Bacteroidia bacterium]|nr:hypothetical protein [Bacteroidia bacterium]